MEDFYRYFLSDIYAADYQMFSIQYGTEHSCVNSKQIILTAMRGDNKIFGRSGLRIISSLILISLMQVSGCDEGAESRMIQPKTLLSYDFRSKEISFRFLSRQPIKNKEFTRSYIGTLNNHIAKLPVTVPVNDLIEVSVFTKLKKMKEVSDIDNFPIRTCVKIFTFKNGTRGSCSGQLVGPNFILTAGHCANSLNGRLWMDSIKVVTLFDDGKVAPNGKTSVVKKAYIFESFFARSGTEDIALLEIDDYLGEEFGYVGIGFNVESKFYKRNLFHKFSYPSIPNPIDPTEKYNGDTLLYNYGLIDTIGSNGLGLPTARPHGSPGQSGSGYLFVRDDQNYVVGVQTHLIEHRHLRITEGEFYSLRDVIGQED